MAKPDTAAWNILDIRLDGQIRGEKKSQQYVFIILPFWLKNWKLDFTYNWNFIIYVSSGYLSSERTHVLFQEAIFDLGLLHTGLTPPNTLHYLPNSKEHSYITADLENHVKEIMILPCS